MWTITKDGRPYVAIGNEASAHRILAALLDGFPAHRWAIVDGDFREGGAK